jgi:sugar phosphate isomerase/epimerase
MLVNDRFTKAVPSAEPSRLSRRRFVVSMLSTVPAARSAALLARSNDYAQAPAQSKKKILVGAHLWVYAATQPGYDPTPVLEDVFADVSAAGLDCLELMHVALRHEDAVTRIGGLIRKYKLPVIGTSFEGQMWNREKHAAIYEDAETVVSRIAALGGRTLGVSVGAAPKPKTDEQLDAQVDLLRRIMALCSRHGVVLNLHNHTYEVENGEHDLKGTLARIPDIKLGPDLNWLVRAGVDPVDFILRYGDRIVFLHLRDQKADGKWSEAMGEGSMDYVAIGKALRAINFAGDAMIELAFENGFKPTRPLRETWRMSREYVRATMGI